MKSRTLAWLLLVAATASGQTLPPTCQWTLGVNGNLCNFRAFAADSLWNVRADKMPTDPNSAAMLSTISKDGLFIDREVPYTVIDSRTQPLVPVTITANGYLKASDNCSGNTCMAPFPLNVGWTQKGQNANAEDYHGIVVDRARKLSWEAEGLNLVNGRWQAQVVAVWNLLGGDYQRPWLSPSANGAGVSWMAGLLTYDEAAADKVDHALMFTLSPPQFPLLSAPVWFTTPALFPLQSNGVSVPFPVGIGTRFVLRADFPETGYGPTAVAIIHGLKRYGMILMDRGADMYVAATGDSRWSYDEMKSLRAIKPTDFHVVVTQPRLGYRTQNWPN